MQAKQVGRKYWHNMGAVKAGNRYAIISNIQE
jgi:hypothetical protein